MRQRCIPSKDTTKAKQFEFRPPDPAWAPTAAVQRARKALKAYDPYLDLWWSPAVRLGTEQPGRWCVKEWLPSTGAWDMVLVWEGPNGEYRDEFPTDVLVAKVAAKSLKGVSFAAHLDKVESSNDTRDADAERIRLREGWREANHKAAYDSKRKFGVRVPGLKK